jgi:hypothetical protein
MSNYTLLTSAFSSVSNAVLLVFRVIMSNRGQ